MSQCNINSASHCVSQCFVIDGSCLESRYPLSSFSSFPSLPCSSVRVSPLTDAVTFSEALTHPSGSKTVAISTSSGTPTRPRSCGWSHRRPRPSATMVREKSPWARPGASSTCSGLLREPSSLPSTSRELLSGAEMNGRRWADSHTPLSASSSSLLRRTTCSRPTKP